MRTVVTELFGTHKAAAATIGKSTTWLSRNLNALNGNNQTRMPGRDFVDTVLTAGGSAVTSELREKTRALYMEALAATHPARHAACARADEAAAAQARCEDVVQALAELESRSAMEGNQHAQEITRLKAEQEQNQREAAATLDEMRLHNGELAAELRHAQGRETELSEQLAETRRRNEDLAGQLAQAELHEGALADELARARIRIKELTDQLAIQRAGHEEAQDTIAALRGELITLQGILAAREEESGAKERQEVVVAEAIAITEQALTAEQARITAGLDQSLGKAAADVQAVKAPAAWPMTACVTGFLVMILGGMTGLATAINSTTAAQWNWDLLDALRGNHSAAIAGAIGVVTGMISFLCGLIVLEDRGHLPQASDDDTGPVYATWI
ncbi:hypothetical protein [Streptomyces sp. NPDC058202]|uniref:hypothetical protein n=1 Tax=Streptomyces sp. NPDC058202 TaxID=3346380 RepID=UPI0036E9BBD7